ncbi:hypothetical protein PAAG_11260 [Paracoccidioides lutzii Pb01]|uniref:Uncharacterized protein n=1 Tax=Paracoccidioides lutzii (strain ATCC MYA-826 / Pb01) TaxID=502779 RepID=A0A0A2V696_PARBA|nr:hypothetical protein PAAG_11260 [Paracoccidioides lutzii Pb01]KGQ01872.1 hypothetical protein PAAG_11260 [Paracoccidioides lutzii Pb01]
MADLRPSNKGNGKTLDHSFERFTRLISEVNKSLAVGTITVVRYSNGNVAFQMQCGASVGILEGEVS